MAMWLLLLLVVVAIATTPTVLANTQDLLYAVSYSNAGVGVTGIDFDDNKLVPREGPFMPTDTFFAPSSMALSQDGLMYVSLCSADGTTGSLYAVDKNGDTVLGLTKQDNVYLDLAFDKENNLYGLATVKVKGPGNVLQSSLYQIDPSVNGDGKYTKIGDFNRGDFINDNGGDLDTDTGIYYFRLSNPKTAHVLIQGMDVKTGKLTDVVQMAYPPVDNILFDQFYDAKTQRWMTVGQDLTGDSDYYVGFVNITSGTGGPILGSADTPRIYTQQSYPAAVSIDVASRSLFVLFEPGDGVPWAVVRANLDDGSVMDKYSHTDNDVVIADMLWMTDCTNVTSSKRLR